MFLWCHQVNQVIIIQRAWRAHKARLDLRSITHQENPPMPVIRKFIHLLDVSAGDLDEEFRLQRIKSDMVKTIRHTHQLEKNVDELDVKIGLLVHNRITLQVTHRFPVSYIADVLTLYELTHKWMQYEHVLAVGTKL
ncbi:Ras GTPase-activating-like protein IQGAP2 [Portunus trituberculatus]|uniref:Ras GTPase-activating-like protein IQGAP2 n=1 Tax=Portunus trituberculatus TaxID=210409 RepID=A0A5B7JJY6_PORTR|nr:Ras GTPase-activating-like protein IQGAP2 [Portunus trituberculatus]